MSITTLFDLTPLGTPTRTTGIGRYIATLAVALKRATHARSDHKLLFLQRVPWRGEPVITEDGAAAVEAMIPGARRQDHHRAWAYRQRLLGGRAMRAAGTDLVHQPHPSATPLFDSGTYRIVTCHDLIPLRFPKHYLKAADGWEAGGRWLARRRYRRARHVVAISQATADDLVSLLDLPPSKLSVVLNGVDLSAWQTYPAGDDQQQLADLGLGSSPYLLYAGQADWRKNSVGMFRGLARARSQAPGLDLQLLWAGDLSPERRRGLQEEARALGVVQAVRLLGYVPDAALAALYRHAVATLFLSRAEGFGLPIVEAMANGCPVITTPCSGTAEVAAGAAWMVDPDDADGVSRAARTLTQDPQAREDLVTRGSARAQELTVERQAEGTLAVYERCAAEARGSLVRGRGPR